MSHESLKQLYAANYSPRVMTSPVEETSVWNLNCGLNVSAQQENKKIYFPLLTLFLALENTLMPISFMKGAETKVEGVLETSRPLWTHAIIFRLQNLHKYI